MADSVWDLNTGQSQLYVRQHTLALHLDSLALRVTDLNTGQSQLYVRQDTLSADQNSLAARQDSLEARYERLNKLVAALRQDSLTAVRTYAADANAGADRALKELKLRNSVVLGVLTAAAGVLIGLLIGDG